MSFKVYDHFYKKAKQEQFLARSVYKLEEIDQKFGLLKDKLKVLDIGYFPGSWTQYCLKKIKNIDAIFRGVDVSPVQDSLLVDQRLKLYEQSIYDLNSLAQVEVEEKFDLIISDMAPKTTGIKHVDQLKSLSLVEDLVYKFPFFLQEGGDVVFKIFDGHDAQNFIKQLNASFEKVQKLKPKSTRKTSKEFYVIGKRYLL
jgi:23S rRNA (uridine2552-2'-O)-methyltransferase